jgi:hypothetical protein
MLLFRPDLDCDSPVAASLIASITGVCHHSQPILFVLISQCIFTVEICGKFRKI